MAQPNWVGGSNPKIPWLDIDSGMEVAHEFDPALKWMLVNKQDPTFPLLGGMILGFPNENAAKARGAALADRVHLRGQSAS